VIPFDVAEDTGSSVLDRILRRLKTTLDSLVKVVTNDRLIAVTFAAATTDTPVRHGLRGPVLTWDVVDRDADANVWRSDTVNTNPLEVLILQASAPVTVTIRVT